ncbi:MAG: DUF2071 domain-containing protein [Candidatus Acidiferrales bacterium]
MDRESSDARALFLSAEWRDLVLLSYEVEPGLLTSRVPRGTELDAFQGKTFVSLVGFRFLRTRLLGFLPVPFHTNFDEVNLRFYVRRHHPDGDRRGVVFIREIVPKLAIAKVARWVYGENYSSHPMQHSLDALQSGAKFEYRWRFRGQPCLLRAESSSTFRQPDDGSLEQFIAEHYWGYSVKPGRQSLEYRVAHPPWKVRDCQSARFEGDASSLCGSEFSRALSGPPDSGFIADGSVVHVFAGRALA